MGILIKICLEDYCNGNMVFQKNVESVVPCHLHIHSSLYFVYRCGLVYKSNKKNY